MNKLTLGFCVVVLLMLSISIKPNEAVRQVFSDEKDQQQEEGGWMKKQHLVLQSLQSHNPVNPPSPNPSTNIPSVGGRAFSGHTPVNPPSPNGCTNIPGGGGPPCPAKTISEKNFARKVKPPSPNPSTYIPSVGGRAFSARTINNSARSVKPPSPNCSTNIPGIPCPAKTISEMNFAGRTMVVAPPHPANAYPEHRLQSGVATNRKLLQN